MARSQQSHLPRHQYHSFTLNVLGWKSLRSAFVMGICLHAFAIGDVVGQASSTLGPTPMSTTPPDAVTPILDVIQLTVYRTSSISYDKSLGNANAASVAGEIGFLRGGCVRRRSAKPRRGDNGSVVAPEEAYSPCEASDVITRHTVILNSTFSCYVMMNGDDCSGCLTPSYTSTPPPDQTCSESLCYNPNISWSICDDVLQVSDGLVGRQPAVLGGGGWWYSFQALSECGPDQQIGDNCTWKEIDEQKHVPVCCVNLYNTTTFLETFEACDNVSSVNASEFPGFDSACPTAPSVMPTHFPTTLPTVMPTHPSTLSDSSSQSPTTNTSITVAIASTTDSGFVENTSATTGPSTTEVTWNETTNDVTNETTKATPPAITTLTTTIMASLSQSAEISTTPAAEGNTSTPTTELNATSVSDPSTLPSLTSVVLASTSPALSTSATASLTTTESASNSTEPSITQSLEKVTSVLPTSASTASVLKTSASTVAVTTSVSQASSSSSSSSSVSSPITSHTTPLASATPTPIANNGYDTSNKHSTSNDAGVAIGVAVVVAIVVLIIAFAIGYKFSGGYTALATTTATESMMMATTTDHHDNPSYDYAIA